LGALERQQCGVASTGRRNTLIFEKDWSVHYEVSPPDIFHRQAEVRYLGSLLSYE
jgi:hypothetical protein